MFFTIILTNPTRRLRELAEELLAQLHRAKEQAQGKPIEVEVQLGGNDEPLLGRISIVLPDLTFWYAFCSRGWIVDTDMDLQGVRWQDTDSEEKQLRAVETIIRRVRNAR